jgi:hypothetical protein
MKESPPPHFPAGILFFLCGGTREGDEETRKKTLPYCYLFYDMK